MPTLCVAMIVKDEAACLAECLSSVKSIADEIVVGDTGSTDDTPAIARHFGAVVFEVPWRDDFAWARNEVIARVTSDWILHLDADEVLDAANAAQIRKTIEADGHGADAIEVTLANYCDDPRAWRWVAVEPGSIFARGRSGYIRTELLRLFRNRRGFEYREAVHENITESVLEREGIIRREPVLIHHYGYALPGEMPPEKAAMYLRIARAKAGRRQNDVKAWHDLAEQALACGHAAEAEQACRHALAIDEHNLAAGTTFANLLLNRGELDQARGALLTLRQRHGDLPHIVTALAAILLRRGRTAEARSELERVIERTPSAIMARYYLSRALDVLGNPSGALHELEQIVAIAPTLPEFRRRLDARLLRDDAEAAYAQGREQEALTMLMESLRLDSDDPVAHNDLGVVADALGDRERARQCFESALKLAPGYEQARENLATREAKR